MNLKQENKHELCLIITTSIMKISNNEVRNVDMVYSNIHSSVSRFFSYFTKHFSRVNNFNLYSHQLCYKFAI